MIASAVRSKSRIVHVDPRIAVAFARIVGWFVRDVTLTRDEARGLMSNLLVTDSRQTRRRASANGSAATPTRSASHTLRSWRGISDSQQLKDRARIAFVRARLDRD